LASLLGADGSDICPGRKEGEGYTFTGPEGKGYLSQVGAGGGGDGLNGSLIAVGTGWWVQETSLPVKGAQGGPLPGGNGGSTATYHFCRGKSERAVRNLKKGLQAEKRQGGPTAEGECVSSARLNPVGGKGEGADGNPRK